MAPGHLLIKWATWPGFLALVIYYHPGPGGTRGQMARARGQGHLAPIHLLQPKLGRALFPNNKLGRNADLGGFYEIIVKLFLNFIIYGINQNDFSTMAMDIHCLKCPIWIFMRITENCCISS